MTLEKSHQKWRAARRKLLRLFGLAGVPGSALAVGVTHAASPSSQSLKTPSDAEGPYYPVNWEGDIDSNLVQLADGQPYLDGTGLLLQGNVLRSDGTPAAGARVEIWQCDSKGRYRHPRDAGEAPAQDGFQGYGHTLTDAQGRYQFRTIKPVAYGSRPPHIHFRIRDQDTSLTTQMYFEGETKEGGLFARFAGFASDRTLLTVRAEPLATADSSGASLKAHFNVYL